jgi:hypothetical protein
MVGADKVIMHVQALRRVPVIRHTMEKPLTSGQAGTLLGLTTRPPPAPHRAGGAGG